MSSPVLWGPAYANNLQSGVGFSGGTGPSLQTGTVDPSAVATAGVAGSLYLNSSNSFQYKKNDNGTTTNWTKLTGVTSNIIASASSGSVTFNTGGPTADANLVDAIVTSGNPVFIGLECAAPGAASYIGVDAGGMGTFYIYRNGVEISRSVINNPGTGVLDIPGSSVWFIDTPAAGSYSYQIYVSQTVNNLFYANIKLVAYELGAGTPAAPAGISRSIQSVSTTTTMGGAANTDYVYFVSGTTTVTLPTAIGNTNQYRIKNTGAGQVTTATTSAQTIDGAATIILDINQAAVVISDNTNWRLL